MPSMARGVECGHQALVTMRTLHTVVLARMSRRDVGYGLMMTSANKTRSGERCPFPYGAHLSCRHPARTDDRLSGASGIACVRASPDLPRYPAERALQRATSSCCASRASAVWSRQRRSGLAADLSVSAHVIQRRPPRAISWCARPLSSTRRLGVDTCHAPCSGHGKQSVQRLRIVDQVFAGSPVRSANMRRHSYTARPAEVRSVGRNDAEMPLSGAVCRSQPTINSSNRY